MLGWLWKDQLHSIAVAPSEIWFGLESSYLLQLCKAWFFLKAGNLSEADSLLRRLPEFLCPEKVMLQASLLAKKGDQNSAIELMLLNLHRCPTHIRYYRQILNHMIEGKDAKNVMPCAHQALSAFGEHAEILYHCTTLNLYKRQPGLARRSSLLAQVSASIRPTSINLSNQLAAYEMNGQTDWLGFLNPSLSEDSFLGNFSATGQLGNAIG